jgi:hypothetical protein
MDDSFVGGAKKRKPVKVPERYEGVLEDLKAGRSDLVDFTNAELGEATVGGILELLRNTQKVRTLKLIRNKLSDEIMGPLIGLLQGCSITSLNLSQNQMTEKALDLLLEAPGLEGRVITLSQNRINQRCAKPKVDRLKKAGLTISL